MAADTHLELPGLDLDRLGAWLSATVPGAGATLSATLIAGGKSNLTYRVTDGDSSWIVRRPPVGELLATAHDMSREYRMMSALALSLSLSMGELGATVMIYPPGWTTLPVTIFSLTDRGNIADGAALTIVLVAITLLLMMKLERIAKRLGQR